MGFGGRWDWGLVGWVWEKGRCGVGVCGCGVGVGCELGLLYASLRGTKQSLHKSKDCFVVPPRNDERPPRNDEKSTSSQ